MSQIKLLTFNGDGLGDKTKLGKTLNWAKRFKPDIILLQETHCCETRLDWYKELWDGECLHSIGSSNCKGASILLSSKLDYNIINSTIDTEGRYVVVDIIIQDKKFIIGVYYGPNIDCPDGLQEYLNFLIPNDNQQVIAGGDYNFVLNVAMDKQGGRPRTHEKSKNLMLDWCENHDMMDIWRIKHPLLKEYTWRSRFPPYVYERLDFFITSNSICNITDDCVIKPGFRSDHRPMILNISTSENIRGPGFWKFNTSLLSDKKYTTLIKKTIQNAVLENQGSDPNLLLDTVKCRIRGASIKYSSYIKRKNKDDFDTWNRELVKLEIELPTVIGDDNINTMIKSINEIKDKIENFINKETARAAFRSRAQYYEEGEKSTKYFYSLEQSNREKKTISKLQSPHGILTDSREILEEEVRFYKKLYTSNINEYNKSTCSKVYNRFFLKEHTQLKEDERNLLTIDIEENEVFTILKSFNDNKCPGSDGLPKEFYIYFWEDIKDILLNSFQYSLDTGSLSIDQRKGIISLIPKKGKDSTNLANWRPLTLLNTDYKTLAKLFAYRFKNLLPSIIKDDQTGFIPNRYIGCNITRLLDSIDHCTEHNIEAMIVSIDFQKAFDSMEWEFVYKAMEYYGFPKKFIQWIKIMYININSCVVNNGHISNLFSPSRGVRQGCPLSPYLFVIGAEILAEYIRRCQDIPAIPISKKYTNISQYADDTSIITIRNNKVLRKIFEILEEFETISGLKVNVGKTQIMPVGANLNNISELAGFNICKEMCVLGIILSCCKKDIMLANYTPVMNKINNCLQIWNQRQLSLFGRIEIAKTLGISRLIYIMTLLPSPGTDYLNKIEKNLLKFIWKYKTPKIRSTVIKKQKDLAGAGMIDIKLKEKCIKLSWLPRLIYCSGVWKEDVLDILSINEDTVEYFLQGNIKEADLPIKLKNRTLWYESFKAWCSINYKKPEDIYHINDILNNNIWYNSNLKINNKITFWKQWYKAGIRKIQDLVNPNSADLYSWLELSTKYNLNGNFLNYYSIISTIPETWKQIIKEVFHSRNDIDQQYESSLNTVLFTSPKPVGTLYKILVNNYNDQPQDRVDRWSVDLNCELDNIEWYSVIYDSYSCTNSVYLRSFIYKFAMRAIYPNYLLHKMKLSQSPLCPKCGQSNETIMHMFWECPTTKIFWRDILSWIKKILKVKIPYSKSVILIFMELDVDITMYKLIILILTLCKLLIYHNVNSPHPITLNRVLAEIFKYEKIERYNATAKKVMQKHIDKWHSLHRLALERELDLELSANNN